MTYGTVFIPMFESLIPYCLFPTEMCIKSAPYVHQKKSLLGIKYGAFLCLGADVAHYIYPK